MAEETIDDIQESTPDDTEQSSEETTPEVDVEALKAENERLAKVAKDQKGRADKAEILLKKQKKEPQIEINSISDEKYERLELKTDGYSSEEVETIMELGGSKALENPIVKEAIATMRKKAKSQEATPSATAKSPIYKNLSERDLQGMSLAELEKIIPQQ